MAYHVQRNGRIIGIFDEPTVHALLNAGTLRATDTYVLGGGLETAPLGSLVKGTGRNHAWLAGAALVAAIGVLLAMFSMGRGEAKFVPMVSAAGRRAGTAEEVHRGSPVVRATIVASSRARVPEFPFQRVESRAVHGRAAILALDDRGRPTGFGAGFVMEDGGHVATARSLVAGASEVQVWFGGQILGQVTDVRMDETANVAVLGLAEARVGLGWAGGQAMPGQALFIAGNALQPLPMVAQLPESLLPPSYAGAAVLNAAGDVCGMVTLPETGAFASGAVIRGLLGRETPSAPTSLAALPAHRTPPRVVIDSAGIEDGELIMQMRNISAAQVNHVVLQVRYHALPPEADETASLERQLASTAVELCTLELEDPASDQYLRKKQEMREVTARLEARRQLTAQALKSARLNPCRTEILAIDAGLPCGIPQSVTIATQAASNWGAEVVVLDAVE